MVLGAELRSEEARWRLAKSKAKTQSYAGPVVNPGPYDVAASPR
jgi:hypothetical protein